MLELLSNIHYGVLAKIVGIDLILGIDNAVVIAMATASLAASQRNTAILFGTAGAILARILFLFIGFWLVGLPFVKFAAGAYLIYLAYSLLTQDEEGHDIAAKPSVWAAAGTIVVADLMMSLDNVVALVGASDGTGSHAFGYTVFGILLSIPIIVLASKGLLKLIDKFPIIVWAGAGLIAYVGAEMALKENFVHNLISGNHTFGLVIAAIVTTLTLTIAFLKKRVG